MRIQGLWKSSHLKVRQKLKLVKILAIKSILSVGNSISHNTLVMWDNSSIILQRNKKNPNKRLQYHNKSKTSLLNYLVLAHHHHHSQKNSRKSNKNHQYSRLNSHQTRHQVVNQSSHNRVHNLIHNKSI